MKNILILLFFALPLLGVFAQDDVTYEIRYWQDVSQAGENEIHIDTMVYVGKDRAGFNYSSADCISYFCKETDKLIYSLLPRLHEETGEWTLNGKFVRRISKVEVPFRSRDREIMKVYVSDINNKASGYGEYSFLSKEFGVIYRWNSDGEIFQLIRIDIVREGKVLEELNLLPLFEKLYESSLF